MILLFLCLKIINMNVVLKSQEGELNYIGTNERGQSQTFSGTQKSCSPMETLLMSAAACSSIDVELILGRMRQNLTSLEVKVEGTRREDPKPAVFTKINIHFIIRGKVKEKKAESAIEMSLEKFCSVTHSLNPEIEITSSYEIEVEE